MTNMAKSLQPPPLDPEFPDEPLEHQRDPKDHKLTRRHLPTTLN